MKKLNTRLCCILIIAISSFASAFGQNVNIPDAKFKAYLIGNTQINTNNDSNISVTEAAAFTGVIDVNRKGIKNFKGLEAFTNLTEFVAHHNSVGTIDVSKNTQLTKIDVGACGLTSIDISHNTKLKDFYASGNNLRGLNLSKNNQLRLVDVPNNDLRFLNLANGNNSAITKVRAQGNANLKCINVDALFTNRDWWKDNSASWETNCNTTDLVNIPDAKFKRLLTNNRIINPDNNNEITKIEAGAYTGVINIENQGITNFSGLEYFINLKEFSAHHNNVGSVDIKYNTYLTKLDVGACGLTSLDLSKNKELTHFYASQNNLTELDLTKNKKLKLVDLAKNKLTKVNLANGNNTILTSVNVQDQPITSNLCVQHDLGINPASLMNWLKNQATVSWSTSCDGIYYSLNTTSTNGTVTKSPNPDTNGKYPKGTSVKLTATPSTGYEFEKWTGDVTGTDPTITVVMNADKNITAQFKQKLHALTITASNGTVTKSVAPDSNGKYIEGTSVKLTATPSAGYEFEKWTGDLTGTDPTITVVMDTDKNITAQFKVVYYALNITATKGTVTKTPNPDTSGKYTKGTSVIIKVTPNAEYEFEKWTGDVTGTNPIITVVMDADKNITALFKLKPGVLDFPDSKFKAYLISNTSINTNKDQVITKTEAEAFTGTIDCSSKDITSLTGIEHFINIKALHAFQNKLSSIDLSKNTKITQLLIETNYLTILDVSKLTQLTDFKAHTNYLKKVNLANGNNDRMTRMDLRSQKNTNSTCIQVDAIKSRRGWEKDNIGNYTTNSCIASYALNITAINGTVTKSIAPNSNGKYIDGTSVKFTATPSLGYEFEKWTGDITGTNPTITVEMNSDKTITALFKLKPGIVLQALNLTATNGTVTKSIAPDSNGKYPKGTSVKLTATPSRGYEFEKWTGDVTGTDPTITVVMDADKNITAQFKQKLHALTITASNGTVTKSISSDANGKFPEGTSVKLTATPNSGYEFEKWTGDVTGTDPTITVVMDADKNVTAQFKQKLHALTITASNGTVTKSVAPDSNGKYIEGTSIKLTATPSTGYEFEKWTGDVTGTESTVTVVMDADKNITALFKLKAGVLDFPDKNFKAYLIGDSNINTNKDQIITKTEAEAFTGTMDCSDKDIASLEGIEHFINMTKLQAFNNKISEIDLSKNTKLTQVLLEKNQLKELDLSKLTALTDLKAHSNQLTKVNLANGNNDNMTRVDLKYQNEATCIQVDAIKDRDGWVKDDKASWSLNCDNPTPALGLTNDLTDKLTVYPNPVNNILKVNSDNIEVYKIEIYNLTGKKILETSESEINVSNLPNGEYIVSVTDIDGNTVSSKVVKK